MSIRWWAIWRRTQYVLGMLVFLALVSSGIYFLFLRTDPTCFDSAQNGGEFGIDCGGSCTRICAFTLTPPKVLWAEAFRVSEGQYNAVAYIENTNQGAGSPEVTYTFTVSDGAGVITERKGTTILPPDSVYPIFEGRIAVGDRIPTKTTLVLSDVDLWVPAETGREQFVVESRELISADTAPRLSSRITNTALTPADNVEVVATIFDSKRNPLTTSRTVVRHFAPRGSEDVIFTWPEPIAKTLRSCSVPTDIMLAIDVSGSMNDDGGTPPEPITSVLAAAKSFVDRLGDTDQVGVVSYATNALVVSPLGRDLLAAQNAITALTITPEAERGSTNTGDALVKTGEELQSARQNDRARKVAVLLTDGLATGGGNNPETYAKTAADTLKREEVELFTIGLGANLNEAFLRGIATDEKHYFKAASSATLSTIYQSISEAICEDGAAVIEIVPKSDATFAPVRL